MGGLRRCRELSNPPVAIANSLLLDEDSLATSVLTSAYTGTDTLTDSIQQPPPGQGVVTLLDAQTGSFSYQPPADFSGMTSFSFGVSDSQGSATGSVISITVSPVNDGPKIYLFQGGAN